MKRRDLIAFGTLAVAGAAASAASAAGPTESAPTANPSLNIAGVGLPIIADGRIRNYVFVTVRLTLGTGQTPEMLRAREPYFRDALVRQAHRTPFVLADDWTRVDSTAIAAWLMRAAPAIAGPGSISAAEVALQTPRRRTGVRRA
ncbi:hypothetical protein [Brevundimonas aurifodinae]|uniref:Tat pathway signal protein n=2 Tax=Brevundimonas TaxID=41275 RepID=A0ABV1NP43_9CAUL|nr:MAG: hypothetical protein B7Z42_11350 [Brevundimonas sp. 12-68-7]OYX31197.1 MAG: hypothetical protein B7Z01_12920 [Brevundimonas subvibrioides]